MARPFGSGRATCESCTSIDVRHWHRERLLRPGEYFSYSWTRGGEPAGTIKVQTESDAVVLTYSVRRRDAAEWKQIEQRVPITLTHCHFGGQRPWFVCSLSSNGRYCGRRVARLFGSAELFACRRCYGLAYASQHQTPRDRSIGLARKIRQRLGGGESLFDPFPEKPRRMHWRTYWRLRERAQAVQDWAGCPMC